MVQETIEALYEKATGSRMEIKVAQKQEIVFIIERELGKAGIDATLNVSSSTSGSTENTAKKMYILQKWSQKWKCYIRRHNRH